MSTPQATAVGADPAIDGLSVLGDRAARRNNEVG